jgi:6-phosphogluconolactonase
MDLRIKEWDGRREIVIPGNREETLVFAVDQFIQIAKKAINERGKFAVALSGGSTPQAIFQALALKENRKQIDWSRVLLFWSDERNVPPDSPESNYRMAIDSGFASLPILKDNIFRMKAESEIEQNSKVYEEIILDKLPGGIFDLVMLGMGDDGHTASLFPHTKGLQEENRLVIANYIPEKKCWRMTFTYKAIHSARAISIYVLGKNKAAMVQKVLEGPYLPEEYPVQRVGTTEHKALWILDRDAAELIKC